MRTDSKAEVQHYVPQVLLRLHVNDPSSKQGSEQVWCFDKKTDKIFSPNIKGILSGSRFYEVEIDGKRISLEEPLSKIEEQVGPILVRLVRDQKLSEIRKRERATIDDLTQRNTVDELHGQPWHTVVEPDVVNSHHVRMVEQRRQRFRAGTA